VTQQRANPRVSCAGRFDTMRQRVRARFSRLFAQCIERQQEQRSRVGLGMPRPHGVRRALIANQNRVHRSTKESLDEQR
jgi:hypothetical protein